MGVLAVAGDRAGVAAVEALSILQTEVFLRGFSVGTDNESFLLESLGLNDAALHLFL